MKRGKKTGHRVGGLSVGLVYSVEMVFLVEGKKGGKKKRKRRDEKRR